MAPMEQFHGTTIISVRRQTADGIQVAIGGDGQVTLGHIVVKGSARKVRKLYHGKVLADVRAFIDAPRAGANRTAAD